MADFTGDSQSNQRRRASRRTRAGSHDAPTARLTRDDWVMAAMSVLARQGIEGVRVEQLAKNLNVTKGSFYWHFKDREQLCEAILDTWRRQNTADLIEYIGGMEEPRERLQRMIRMPFETSIDDDPMRLALGLRLWARNSAKVQTVLREVDDLRVRLMSQLMIACGIGAEEARARSVIAYSYMRTAMSLVQRDDRELQTLCEALLLGDKRTP